MDGNKGNQVQLKKEVTNDNKYIKDKYNQVF
jgi:hypothetical protein